jgi:hypothetical protein
MNVRKYLTKKNILIGLSVIVIITVAIVVFFLIKPTINATCKNGEYMCESSSSSRKNNCIPSNFCSDFPGLINNKDNCSCAMSCPTGSTSFPEDPGMRLNDDNKWEPSVPLSCGTPCQYADDKFCTKGYLCGQVMTDEKKVLDQGCRLNTKYHQCKNAICPDIYPDCSPNGYCNIPYCGKDITGNDNKKVYACTQNSDCIDDINKGGTCYFNDNELNQKGINNVGYCKVDGGQFKRIEDDNCLYINEIGEHKTDDGKYHLVTCPGGTGVNVDLQCPEALTSNCATHGICPNYWQAKIDSTEPSNCVTGGNWEHHDTVACCGLDYQVKGAFPTFCCLSTSKNCRSETKYPYAKGLIDSTGILGTKIQCNNNSDCTKYNDKLWQALHPGSTAEANPTAGDYASLFCGTGAGETDGTTGYCYAYCGYVNQPDDGYQETYIVSNHNDNTGSTGTYSYCLARETNCTLGTQHWTYASPVNNIPICYPPGDTSKLHWSNDYPNQPSSAAFESEYTQNLSSKCLNHNTCAAAGVMEEGVYKVDTNEDGCVFTINCSNSSVKPTGATKFIPWTKLSEPDTLNSAFNTDPGWDKTDKIFVPKYDTKYDPKKFCKGDSDFSDYLTTTTLVPSGTPPNACAAYGPWNPSLNYSGRFCEPNIQTGECVDS